MEDEWKKLYEKYGNRKNKIIVKAVLVAAAVVLVSAVMLFAYSYSKAPETKGEPYSTRGLQNINAELSKAISSDSYRLQTNLPDTQCFWIRSTANENGFVLEVREYNSSAKNCIGDFLNKTEIPLDRPINLIGSDCICGRKICELENVLENNVTNLKIKGC